MAKLDLPAVVYDWLVAFFTGHAHRTVYNKEVSSTRSIMASIIQGSSIGPASYTVTAADLQPLYASNRFFKFAEDTYLVVPAESVDTRAAELSNIITWAATNNLKLNKLKTKEVVFYDSRRCRKLSPPPLLPDVDRNTTLKVLGVTLSSNTSPSEHIRRVVSDSAQTLYALRVLRHHGMNDAGLQTVFRAVVVPRLTYASPAWRGFITGADLQRVDAFIRRCKRSHYCPSDMPDIVDLMEAADECLFCSTLNNPHHTLHALLPPQSTTSQNYQLRQHVHDRQLPVHLGHLIDKNCITRSLYKDMYLLLLLL